MNGQTRHRKGKVTASPRAKAKVKARARENNQEKGTTTRTRLDLQMKMDSARWVILVSCVKELNLSVMSKRMVILRVPDWIEQLISFTFKSATVLRWIGRNCQVRRREFLIGVRSQRALVKNSICEWERCFSPLEVEMIDQFVDSGSVVSTCPVDYATSVPTKSTIHDEFGECVG